MIPIDLRSDTVTRPSPEMRRAMADAEVGDDVLDGDPTTRRLEQRVAELLGTEDALLFPSGTQANQVGVALLASAGTELLVEADAHLVHYELAGVAANWGIQIRPVATPDGLLTAACLAAAIRPRSPYLPRPGALAIENTHNAAGGRVMSVETLRGVIDAARTAGLPIHLDGARLWNAAVALGVPVARLAAGADTVMVSLSKGLGCPVGACLGLRARDRARAWELRKRLGGGMRQSGVLAAAGLWALERNVNRLAEDHANARFFATGLAACRGVRVSSPESNIVMIDLAPEGADAASAAVALERAGVRLAPFGLRRLRAVTHLDVNRADVTRAAAITAEVLASP
ncbi:MAG TPA: GntG family PLP-dependent aldolase [Gemmatimonadales bacterium]|nr:GntG family PLP-dependent aldolase [Gemmatimonadales bacterium]